MNNLTEPRPASEAQEHAAGADDIGSGGDCEEKKWRDGMNVLAIFQLILEQYRIAMLNLWKEPKEYCIVMRGLWTHLRQLTVTVNAPNQVQDEPNQVQDEPNQVQDELNQVQDELNHYQELAVKEREYFVYSMVSVFVLCVLVYLVSFLYGCLGPAQHLFTFPCNSVIHAISQVQMKGGGRLFITILPARAFGFISGVFPAPETIEAGKIIVEAAVCSVGFQVLAIVFCVTFLRFVPRKMAICVASAIGILVLVWIFCSALWLDCFVMILVGAMMWFNGYGWNNALKGCNDSLKYAKGKLSSVPMPPSEVKLAVTIALLGLVLVWKFCLFWFTSFCVIAFVTVVAVRVWNGQSHYLSSQLVPSS